MTAIFGAREESRWRIEREAPPKTHQPHSFACGPSFVDVAKGGWRRFRRRRFALAWSGSGVGISKAAAESPHSKMFYAGDRAVLGGDVLLRAPRVVGGGGLRKKEIIRRGKRSSG